MKEEDLTGDIVDMMRQFIRLESAGGMLVGSILSAIVGYVLLHLSLPGGLARRTETGRRSTERRIA